MDDCMKHFLITCLAILSITSSVYGASISIGLPEKVQVGTRISAQVVIDTENENINSFDFTIAFPKDLVSFDGYGDQGALVPLWIVPPREDAGSIYLSGIIPGGVDRTYDPEHPQDYRVTLTTLYFVVKKTGVGSLIFTHALVLKNDGHGSAAKTTVQPTVITSIESGIPSTVSSDTVPPLPFIVTIIPKPPFGKTPSLAQFNATDTESGIEHYEAAIHNGKWVRVTNPYALPYRVFPYMLSIRAFDFSGNYREQDIRVGEMLDQRVVAVSILIVLVLLLFLYRRKRKLYE